MARGFKMGGSGGRLELPELEVYGRAGTSSSFRLTGYSKSDITLNSASYSKIHLGDYERLSGTDLELVIAGIPISGSEYEQIDSKSYGTSSPTSGTINADIDISNYKTIKITLRSKVYMSETSTLTCKLTDCYIE